MSHTNSADRALLSVDEFANKVGLGRSKVYELISSKEIETLKIGKRRLIPVQAMDEWIAGLRERAAAAA